MKMNWKDTIVGTLVAVALGLGGYNVYTDTQAVDESVPGYVWKTFYTHLVTVELEVPLKVGNFSDVKYRREVSFAFESENKSPSDQEIADNIPSKARVIGGNVLYYDKYLVDTNRRRVPVDQNDLPKKKRDEEEE